MCTLTATSTPSIQNSGSNTLSIVTSTSSAPASSSISTNSGSSSSQSLSSGQVVPPAQTVTTQTVQTTAVPTSQTVTTQATQSASNTMTTAVPILISSGPSLNPNTPPQPCPAKSYWDGSTCLCEVGFYFYKGQCQVFSIPAIVPQLRPITNPSTNSTSGSSSSSSSVNPCNLQFQYYNGSACVCIPGFSMINSNCVQDSSQNPNNPPANCGSNSYFSNGVCICISGHILVSGNCVFNNLGGSCQTNSFNNGLGFCVCSTGFYNSSNQCIQGSPCSPNSTRQANGTCVCDAGLNMLNGFCSRCPLGALWSPTSSTCVFVCGANSAYNNSVNACVCNSGFGLMSGSCQQCPNNYFVRSGYCVTCPIYSNYNLATQNCQC